jgi:hypothetical protein
MTPIRFGAARSWLWPGIVASLAILGLLLIFHQVVRGAVRQGELRQAAAMAHADAVRRCQARSDSRERDGCLARLSTVPPDEAVVQARNAER